MKDGRWKKPEQKLLGNSDRPYKQRLRSEKTSTFLARSMRFIIYFTRAYIRIYKVSDVPEREFLTDVTVASNRYKMGQRLKVDDTKERVVKLLGNKFQPLSRPNLRVEVPKLEKDCKEKDNVCALEYTDSRSHVYFSFKRNRVARIDWVFWGE